jgi:hypothetical protein
MKELAMKTIPLTRGLVAFVDDEDFDRLSKHKWCARKDKNTFYAARNLYLKNSKRMGIQMHREILNLTNPIIQIDHKDHNGLNNQKNNLRICNNQKNSCNRRKRNDSIYSRYKGVWFHVRDKKWQASIQVGGKRMHLGYFKSEIEAASIYNAAALKYHGEFALTNQI